MARRNREDGPGVWHHVFGRGAGGRTIFEDDLDRGVFLRHLEAQVVAGRLVVFAYVLMTNHFHLLVMSPNGELAVAMRELLRPFVILFNPRRGRDGPLFRSRFGSKPVKTVTYRTAVLHYIDRNPQAAGMVGRSIDYRHGSAFHFHHGTEPAWLDRSWAEWVIRESRGVVGLPKGQYGVGRAREYEQESDQLVEARMRAVGTLEPLDQEFESEAARQAWLVQYLMGGAARPECRSELPSASALTVIRVSDELSQEEGNWCTQVQRGELGWLEIVKSGLVRRMSGRTEVEMSQDLGWSRWTVARRVEVHEKLLKTDPAYREMALRLSTRILWGREQVAFC